MHNFARSAVIYFAVFFCAATVFYQNKTKAASGRSEQPVEISEIVQVARVESLPKRPNATHHKNHHKKIGIQAGHWKREDLPDEQWQLRRNTGAESGGKAEWEVNLAIAERAEKILEEKGFDVEILPSTVPVDYTADAFISIHADGSLKPEMSGFKVSSPAIGPSERSDKLAKSLEKDYRLITDLEYDSKSTPNMRYYYGFNHEEFHHAISPNTPAAIIETGYLTGDVDREVIVHQPEKAAFGIALAVEDYFDSV